MTRQGNLAEPVRAIVDDDGRLITADPMLLRLHMHCGGYEGGPLAVPGLADLCRLSKQLGMNLSRPVRAANDDSLIEMWVETRLVDEAGRKKLTMTVLDWQEKPVQRDNELETERSRDLDRLNGLGRIRTDTALRIVSCALPKDSSNAEGLVGQSLFDIFDILPPSKQTKILEVIAERQPVRNQRVRKTLDDKGLYHLSGQPLIDNAGTFSGYRFQLEAEEEEIQVEQKIPVGSKKVLISDSLFGSQLGPALRQPLGKIIANAETIGGQLEGPLRGDYANYAKDIADAGRHLMDLVNDLSDLEAIERDNFTVAADDIDLVDLAHRAAGLLAVKASDHQIRIDLPEKDDELPATGEFRRVIQILVNLIGNAIRYSPDGSVIKVKVGQEADRAHISVIDQGDGIPKEDRERIFEKFERLGRSGDGGSGLGLFISRRLAAAMDGTLIVDNQVGGGAKFTLDLPAR